MAVATEDRKWPIKPLQRPEQPIFSIKPRKFDDRPRVLRRTLTRDQTFHTVCLINAQYDTKRFPISIRQAVLTWERIIAAIEQRLLLWRRFVVATNRWPPELSREDRDHQTGPPFMWYV